MFDWVLIQVVPITIRNTTVHIMIVGNSGVSLGKPSVKLTAYLLIVSSELADNFTPVALSSAKL